MGKLTDYARTICNAEKDLGRLTTGQRVNLLLDNHLDLKDSTEAREIVERLNKYMQGASISEC